MIYKGKEWDKPKITVDHNIMMENLFPQDKIVKQGKFLGLKKLGE